MTKRQVIGRIERWLFLRTVGSELAQCIRCRDGRVATSRKDLLCDECYADPEVREGWVSDE